MNVPLTHQNDTNTLTWIQQILRWLNKPSDRKLHTRRPMTSHKFSWKLRHKFIYVDDSILSLNCLRVNSQRLTLQSKEKFECTQYLIETTFSSWFQSLHGRSITSLCPIGSPLFLSPLLLFSVPSSSLHGLPICLLLFSLYSFPIPPPVVDLAIRSHFTSSNP